MSLTLSSVLVVLALFHVSALVYLWTTNRRLDALDEEIETKVEATRQEVHRLRLNMKVHIDQISAEMRERIAAANERLDEHAELSTLNRITANYTDLTYCLRGPGGMSRRLPRSDHRQ